MDTLAGQTPFDYLEEHTWADPGRRDFVTHTVRLGHPRLGRARDDLRFVEGENIITKVTAGSSDNYANDVIGIGNGDGAEMIHSQATVDDGRLRRTKFITDKTITRQTHMDDVTRNHLLRLSPALDVTEVVIAESRNAPIGAIMLGDDIEVQVRIEAYGNVRMWLRVLSITEADEESGFAVLGTQRSSAFLYNPTTEVSG
jgi:hypothetical protein